MVKRFKPLEKPGMENLIHYPMKLHPSGSEWH